MNILVIGSGGREHTIGWKLAQSPSVTQVYFAPGNAGTALIGTNLPISPNDSTRLAIFCHENEIGLVVIGPEAPLAAGLADDLRRSSLRVFGPTSAAARLESSKAFAREFMQRHEIPGARFAIFNDYKKALSHLNSVAYPVVVKASGLAAGKGVIVPADTKSAQEALHTMLVDREFGEAGQVVVIEERLYGEEISLMAFTDGRTVRPMPPAQDHKRLLDGDLGPNTGGMGAFAPTPLCPPQLVSELTVDILQKAVDGLRGAGTPFIGVLYAGLMLTKDGPRVLEFNCRFGDPETQVVLPLLEGDLLEIMLACTDGKLDQTAISWRNGSALTVILASENYPGKPVDGKCVSGMADKRPGTMIFHAGTRSVDDTIVSAGGRVLGVTGWGETLQAAYGRAYGRLQGISFEGMQFRKDIGRRAIALAMQPSSKSETESAYTSAGVNIQAGNEAVSLMSEAVRATYTRQVLQGIGAFGGLFDAGLLKEMQHPVLVSSTDGVGTKVKLAAHTESYESIGEDLVNHCINDILVQGARPLFFMDYFAADRLDPEIVAAVVTGIARACQQAGMALLGGETAEMPGVYAPGEFDLAGTIVGVVEKDQILPRGVIKPGDVLVGLASSGPHTNGYSLIRKIFENTSLKTHFPELNGTLESALLVPHRSYLNLLRDLLPNPDYQIKALAHLTGGGFLENIPRILPEDVNAEIQSGSWNIPPIFQLIQQRGQVSDVEMHRVFNMGIGMVVILPPETVESLRQAIPEETWVIGRITAGEKMVDLV